MVENSKNHNPHPMLEVSVTALYQDVHTALWFRYTDSEASASMIIILHIITSLQPHLNLVCI